LKFPRAAGVLLHPTSLPGPNGIGELGRDAHRFLDFLGDAGLEIWQVLPLGPTGDGDSPYQCFSAFAGNPLLIDTSRLVGMRAPASGDHFPAHCVEFERVIPHKQEQLRQAIAAFTPDDEYDAFVALNADWLPDYALFMALKGAHGGAAWPSWEAGAASRDPAALAQWRSRLAEPVRAIQVEQYLFYRQFRALREQASARSIRLMGDIPIYVAHDSADVWSHRDLFQLNPDGSPRTQAGVPPDYFSATGQLWGNPIYDWNVLERQGFAWWVRRMQRAFEQFDLVRIDHFRGFEAYWEVPGNATTAINGRWTPGPGAALFDRIAEALGPLPIVAENLGMITPAVEQLRERCGFPGMSILQFAFGGDGQAHDFRPHCFPRERVVYTGTHDNDTTLGWWHSTGEGDSTREATEVLNEKAFAMRYLGSDGRDMNWTLIRAALASVADTVLIPMQDVLSLGSEARMNLPGRESGNWRWRFSWDQLTPDITARLRDYVELYDRRRILTRPEA
jgi:4-alpha-glucanotransferase